MDDICTGCLCSGRKLLFIAGTSFYQIYSQILNEKSTLEVSQICIKLCWECRALLQKFQHFKAQVKRNYTELLWNVPPPSYPPRLTTNSIYNLIYPELQQELVKEELGEGIKTEEEEHLEPEAFVNDLMVERDEKEIEKVESEGFEEKERKEVVVLTKKSKRKPKEKKPSKNKIKIKKKRKSKKVEEPIEPMSDGVSDTDVLLDVDREDSIEQKIEEVAEKQSEVLKEKCTVDTKVVKPKPATKPVLQPKQVEILPDKPQCVECGKTFSSKKTYRYHMNVLHKGNNHYICPRCGKIYQWKSNLSRHMRTHKAVDAGELYCEECDKSFASVATYRQHLRLSRRHVSENEFSFTCNECGKKFVNKTRLRDHIDWEHLKKIKFQCQPCNKAFKCHTSLYIHLQNVHVNKEKKDNLCHVCGKSYQNAAKLKYHIVAMHNGETPYRCSQCTAAFGWYSSLYRHVREVHYKVRLQPKKSKKGKKHEIEPPTYMNYHP